MEILTSAIRLVDIFIINYLILTPLCFMFWHGTYGMINFFILDGAESTMSAAMTSFATGTALEIGFVQLPHLIGKLSSPPTSPLTPTSNKQLVLTRLSNAVLGVAQIMHYRGVELFFGEVFSKDNLATAVTLAILATLMLYALQSYRNVAGLPLMVHLDNDLEHWFDFPTIFKYSGSNTLLYSVDVFVTVFVALSLVPLHWITVGWTLDLLIYPGDENYSKSAIVSLLLGYTIVATAQFLHPHLKDISKTLDGRPVLKPLFEDVCFTAAMIGVITVWKGGMMVVDATARNYPITIGGCDGCDESSPSDITWIFYQLGSIQLLSLLYGSNNLPITKGLDTDGGMTEGKGLDVPTQYLGFFFKSA